MTARRVKVALIALAGAGLLGACRGSADGPSVEEAAEFKAALQYAQCMRAHGIEGLPDPQVSSNGFMLIGVPLMPDDEGWQAAEDACPPDLEAAPTPPEPAADTTAITGRELSAEESAVFDTELQFAQCLRDHGVEGYPDPQISRRGFLLLSVPVTPGDEVWNAAQVACQSVIDPVPDDMAGAAWARVEPGGDCRCSDGSAFSFWVRPADPERVVFFLQDGGACWSAETCAPDSGLYTTAAEGPPGDAGIFDVADARNPLADFSVVYVPYCTGDVHLGNTTTAYSPELTVHHNGYVNGTAALDHLARTFPDATDVVVIGESAGSIAAPLYGGLVSDRLPDAAITVLADGSGAYPDQSAINRLLAASWGTSASSSIPGLFVDSGRHDADIVFARHDYAYDERQQYFLELVGAPASDLLTLIDANEALIESGGVNLRSYVAPGDDHTVVSDGPFYTEAVNGQPLVEWVGKLVEREPVDDVHCRECRAS